MKHSPGPWTRWVATAAVVALPVVTSAQTPQPAPQPTPAPTEQPRQAPQPAPPPSEQPTSPPAQANAPQHHGTVAAQEHLRQAQVALAGIQDTAVAGTARPQLTELRKHMSALERASAAPAKPSGSTARQTTPNWATEVAAIDRILTQMIGPATGTPAATAPPAGPTGTSGTKAQTAVTLDEPTRARLMEVRTHITAFAASMSGAPQQPSAAQPSATAPATPSPATQTPAPTPTPTEPPAATQPPAPTPAHPPAATPNQPPATAPTQPPSTTPPDPAAPATAPAGKVDSEASKRHLTAARDTLSQLTQLPEAAQLAGDARTQVSQLIANFNELITTQSEWRAAYGKVQANLTALVGAETTDEANVPPPATATPGAVGTSGMATLDPKIREKLVEFRRHLKEFERSAGGAAGQ